MRTLRSPESSSPSAVLVLILLDVDAVAVPFGVDEKEVATGVQSGVALPESDAVGLEADPVTGRNDARRSQGHIAATRLVEVDSFVTVPVALTPVIRASMLPSQSRRRRCSSPVIVVGEAVVVESAGVDCNHDIAVVLLVEFDAVLAVVLNL